MRQASLQRPPIALLSILRPVIGPPAVDETPSSGPLQPSPSKKLLRAPAHPLPSALGLLRRGSLRDAIAWSCPGLEQSRASSRAATQAQFARAPPSSALQTRQSHRPT